MKSQPSETLTKGFCTFCMDSHDMRRIGTHVKRCTARKDDADCIQVKGEHPMAFLLMAAIESWPEAWLCIEAHCKCRFSDLASFIRWIWVPGLDEPGEFIIRESLIRRRAGEREHRPRDPMLEEFLREKDEFWYLFAVGETALRVNLKVVGRSPTAIMHRPVDVAAFPLGSDGGRSPQGQPNPPSDPEDWNRGLPRDVATIRDSGFDPEETIQESFAEIGDTPDFVS